MNGFGGGWPGKAIGQLLTAARVPDFLAFMQRSSAPVTPPSGQTALYAKSDGKLYRRTHDGTETEIGAGAGGTAASTTFTPAGTIAATDVQAAIEELDGDSRMSDARTPTAHAIDGASHTGNLAESAITGLVSDLSAKAPIASPTFTGVATTPALAVSGLTGSVSTSRYVGATTSGAPTTGAHLAGDWAWALDGHIWLCTVLGTPGTWVEATAGGGGSVATDAIWDAAGDLAVGTGANTAAKLAMGSALQVLRVNAGATTLEWAAASGGGSLTTSTTYLTSTVAVTNANQFYDGPSLSLAAGTWLLLGELYPEATSTNGAWTVRLWDGTTVASESQMHNTGGIQAPSIFVAGLVSPGSTTTYKVSAACTGTGNRLQPTALNNGTANKACYLLAIKVA